MDVVEFAEKVLNIKLLEYQKVMLRKMEKLPRNAQIVAGRRGFIMLVSKKGERDETETEM